jgi:hypothetical protein
LAARELEWAEATPVASNHWILIGRCAGIASDEKTASNRVGYTRAKIGIDNEAGAAAFAVSDYFDTYDQLERCVA